MTTKLFQVIVGKAWVGTRDADHPTAHDADEGEVSSSAYAITRSYNDLDSYDNKFVIYRGFAAFDTTALAGEELISAKLIYRLSSYQEVDAGHGDLHVVQGVQTVPDCVAADFGNHLLKTTSGGVLTYENMVTVGSPSFPLNANGLSWITRGGTTKFCFRIKGDIEDWVPTGESNGCATYGLTENRTLAVSTRAASDIGENAAKLNGIIGTVPPFILVVTYTGEAVSTYPRVRFQYGETTGYGTDTPWQYEKIPGDTFFAEIEELEASTLYHYRAQVEDEYGTRNGSDRDFTTTESGQPPIEERYFAWII